VVGGRNSYVVEVVDEGYGFAAVVLVVGDDGFGQAELRASAPAVEEYRECIASLRSSLAPY
jgi:hypothetical protein